MSVSRTVGPDSQIIRAGRFERNQTQVLKCKVCGRTKSAPTRTPLFNPKANEETFYRPIRSLVEGNGIKATARIMGLDSESVCPCLDTASQHVEALSPYLMVSLHFDEVQFGPLMGPRAKKTAAALVFEEAPEGRQAHPSQLPASLANISRPLVLTFSHQKQKKRTLIQGRVGGHPPQPFSKAHISPALAAFPATSSSNTP